jgi:hypothetical protein
MKTLFLAVFVSCLPVSALADPWVMRADHTCQSQPASIGEMFNTFSRAAEYRGLPQPQVDYTTGASLGMTILRYTDVTTGNAAEILFFSVLEVCEVAGKQLAKQHQ